VSKRGRHDREQQLEVIGDADFAGRQSSRRLLPGIVPGLTPDGTVRKVISVTIESTAGEEPMTGGIRWENSGELAAGC
jgi:hypothetical protein